jgi:hypothetical protein
MYNAISIAWQAPLFILSRNYNKPVYSFAVLFKKNNRKV